jgi:uncharacterized protein YeaO (DUF488 family)
MSVRIVRLGTARHAHEGLRIGTVRRPPRGVPKSRYAADNWFDVWLPILAPSAALVKMAQAAADESTWRRFRARYRQEMAAPEAAHVLDLLVALSEQTNFSVGCYCADASRCHRSVLRELLEARGARVEPSDDIRTAQPSTRPGQPRSSTHVRATTRRVR